MTAVKTPTIIITDPTIATTPLPDPPTPARVAARLHVTAAPPAGFPHRPDRFGKSRIGRRRSLRTRHGSLAFQSAGRLDHRGATPMPVGGGGSVWRPS